MAKGAANTRGKRSGGSVANVTHALKGIGFPARKSDLLDRAKKNHAERGSRHHWGNAGSRLPDHGRCDEGLW